MSYILGIISFIIFVISAFLFVAGLLNIAHPTNEGNKFAIGYSIDCLTVSLLVGSMAILMHLASI